MLRLVPVLLLATVVCAGDRKPDAKVKGKFFTWRSGNIPYSYRVPKSYRAGQGATLLVVFKAQSTVPVRGKLTYEGAYDPQIIANVRTDDLMLVLDKADWTAASAKDLGALLTEFRGTFKLNATIVFARGGAASLALLYAGRHPAEIQGVVADTPDAWKEIDVDPARQAHQAIVFHHENAAWLEGDYAGVRALLPKYGGLPHVRRSMILRADWKGGGYGERAFLTSRLSWCEAVTCKDPKRLATLFQSCAKEHLAPFADFGMIHDIAKRLADMEGASRGARAKARKAVAALDKLAQQHVKALTRLLKGNDAADWEAKPWVGYLPAFLMLFDGVPAAAGFAKKWEFHVARQEELAAQHFRLYLAERGQDRKSAFRRGAEIIRGAPLAHCLFVEPLWRDLHDWSISAGSLRLGKQDVRDYEQWFDARREGIRRFQTQSAKFKP